MFRPLLLSLGIVASLATATFESAQSDVAQPVARATPRADAVTAPRELVNDAIAAAVIGSVTRQFNTDDVTVKLDAVEVLPASIQDREVRGTGRLRIGGDAEWIPFRLAAHYDTESTEVTYPRLQLGQGAPARAADPRMTARLSGAVSRALAEEFSGQPVAWALSEARTADQGGRFVRVSATGVADFGAEGQVPADVEALFDRVTGRFLRVSYELDPVREAADAAMAIAGL